MVSEVNYHSRANWFNFCAMGGFWITGILLAFYLFHVIEKLYFIPWIMVVSTTIDYIYTTIGFIWWIYNNPCWYNINRRWAIVACGVSLCWLPRLPALLKAVYSKLGLPLRWVFHLTCFSGEISYYCCSNPNFNVFGALMSVSRGCNFNISIFL